MKHNEMSSAMPINRPEKRGRTGRRVKKLVSKVTLFKTTRKKMSTATNMKGRITEGGKRSWTRTGPGQQH